MKCSLEKNVLYIFKIMFLFFCSVGLDFPTIEVRYENLNIEALAHVGSRGLPTFINATINSLEVNFLLWSTNFY